MSDAAGAFLCRVGDVPDGGAREVALESGSDLLRVLLIRRGGEVWAYRNRCPHFSLPLNYRPQVFHTYDGGSIMCAHHSAMFRFEDGYCFDGPCLGSNLDRIELHRHEDQLHLRTLERAQP